MKPRHAQTLRDPISGATLNLQVYAEADGEVTEGLLRDPGSSRWYPIINGVPRVLLGSLRDFDPAFLRRHNLADQVATPDDRPGGHAELARAELARAELARAEQGRTNVTFSDKWRRFKNYGFEPQHRAFLDGWYVKKLGLADEAALRTFYAGKPRILEIGPGSGFNTVTMASCNGPAGGEVHAVDISEAADTTYGNARSLANTHVVQADLMNLPYADDTFDFAIADGVLHHTPDTRAAVEAVYRKVRPGGQFFFYVYRKMGAARVFCDEHIRGHFTGLDPEACYQRCEGLTELGRELSRLGAKVTLEIGIPELGIPPGTHDVQRLLYYNFLKCFWNDAFDWETNNMVNFDWYHPHHAWQQTEDEVAAWLRDLGVRSYAFNPANPNGISCLLTKPA